MIVSRLFHKAIKVKGIALGDDERRVREWVEHFVLN